VRLLCLLLCLATWRGPLPWIHEHEDNPTTTALAGHLAAYHAGSHDHHGWHWHVLMPFGRCPCGEDHDDTARARDPLSYYGALVLPKTIVVSPPEGIAELWGEVSPWVDSRHPLGEPCCHDPPGRATSFLGSLLAAAPLRAVTGVALC
jgi:hypothetical protein